MPAVVTSAIAFRSPAFTSGFADDDVAGPVVAAVFFASADAINAGEILALGARMRSLERFGTHLVAERLC